MVGPYARFLVVANEAARVATSQQKAMIRALATRNLKPEEYTPEIEKIMGWHEDGGPAGWESLR